MTSCSGKCKGKPKITFMIISDCSSIYRNVSGPISIFYLVFLQRTVCLAFHYAKDSGNFGRNSNGKVRFGFFRPEYSGSPSGGGPLISVGIFRSKFAVPFLTNRFFALIREFGNDQKWQELFLLVGAV